MQLRTFPSIQPIPQEAWDRLAPADFPFMHYHFLRALETTDCLGSRTGWQPLYQTLWDREKLVAACVFFVKSNSYGEYIFDFAWAEAFHSSGLSYYPKLVTAVPFTPATGPKLLFLAELDEEQRTFAAKTILHETTKLGAKIDVSSLHALFIPPAEIPYFEEAGYRLRHSYQYHWRNDGYGTFADFLAALRAKRRREIVRERNQVTASGVRIERYTGDQITADHARIFFRFYADTVDKRGGFDYLTEGFFADVFATMKDRLLFVLASDGEGRPVAGALNYFGAKTLFGRHWGCLAEYRALHFEVCYYQGIEFAIERGFALFEAGAQGEHKFNRGFLPSLTYSAHRIENAPLDQAIADFLLREKAQIRRLFRDYDEHTPFSRDENAASTSPR